MITASRPGGAEPFGREYPWGLAEAEAPRNPNYVHSELDRLRRFLLIDGLLDLKQASKEHYEAYRARALRQQERGIRALIRAVLSPTQLLAACLLLPKPRSFLRGAVQAPMKTVRTLLTPLQTMRLALAKRVPVLGAVLRQRFLGGAPQEEEPPPPPQRKGLGPFGRKPPRPPPPAFITRCAAASMLP